MVTNSLPPSVLVIDDEPDLRTLYELTLLREGYRVEAAGTLAEAQALLAEHRYDAVITDMRLPDGLGLSILHTIQEAQRPERCIVMTAYGSAENAVEALKSGAFDYLTKPVDLKQFRAVVASAIQQPPAAVQARAPSARGGAGSATGASKGGSPANGAPLPSALARMVGDSDAMQSVKQRIVKVAGSMAPVLIRGESGTGKELVAGALHGCSHRASGPFIAVNCSAIPESLLEAEFFGARKGSYTGSTQDREGYFQAARTGTLFLDEIGDLPLTMQSKLLRAIQERQVRPIGSTQEESVDVRIVSATHKDLAADVQAGRFRQDLYYRLNVIEVVIPPLRERRSDVPALCHALLARIAQESGIPVPELPHDVLAQIQAHPLPGNVRELENLLHRAVALGGGEGLVVDTAQPSNSTVSTVESPAVTPAALSHGVSVEAAMTGRDDSSRAASALATGSDTGTVQSTPSLPADLQGWLDAQERAILVRALQESGFNRTAAATRLGLSLRQIRYRIARLNIATPGDTDGQDDGP